MGKLRSNESRFSIIELFLILVIVIALGAVGHLAYKDHHKTASANATTSISSPSNSLSSAAASNLVRTFYNQLMDSSANQNAASEKSNYEQTAIQKYGTQNLANFYRSALALRTVPSYDPITCSNSVPNSLYSVTTLTSATTATVRVIEQEGTATNTVDSADIAAKVIMQNGTPKINSISCQSKP
jgi:hypothetical protein